MQLSKYIYQILVLVSCSIAVNCGNILLPEPVSYNRETMSPSQDVGKRYTEPHKDVEEIYARIKVNYDSGVEQDDYSSEIKQCLSFLLNTFGYPQYQDTVSIQVTQNPLDNGKMAWSDKHNTERTITLHEFNFIPSELRVLVHELFHAFYQSTLFIKVHPDFITEGLAIYAEYKFRYQDLGNEEIAQLLKRQFNAQSAGIVGGSFDFDRPFMSYNAREMDRAYLLSGLFFFNQNPSTLDGKIRDMLTANRRYSSRMAFETLAFEYHLDIGLPLRPISKKVNLSLPQPKKLTTEHTITEKTYCVQVATLKDEEGVLELERKLQYWGYHVIKNRSSNMYIVSVGLFKDKDIAEEVRDQLLRYEDPDIRDPFVRQIKQEVSK